MNVRKKNPADVVSASLRASSPVARGQEAVSWRCTQAGNVTVTGFQGFVLILCGQDWLLGVEVVLGPQGSRT